MRNRGPSAKPVRLLVCGGRDFTDHGLITSCLTRILVERGIDCIIEGECPTPDNPDKFAASWADAHDIPVHRCPVVRSIDGPWPAAGPRRNRRMRDTHHPTFGLAFPRANGTWGSGTLGMIHLLEEIGVRTWRVDAR
jgi:hypothetical protein